MNETDTLPLYRITVRGWLDASWSDWFEGMLVHTDHDTSGGPITVLSGRVRDQAALQGILTKTWTLNLPLLAVICIAGYGIQQKKGSAPATAPNLDRETDF